MKKINECKLRNMIKMNLKYTLKIMFIEAYYIK